MPVLSGGPARAERSRTMRSARLVAGLSILVAFGCSTSPPRAPLFDDLGSFGRKVSTPSSVAQRYFDQGLVFTYAFNYEEALRSYREAERADPSCAMAAWGVALVSGPHINNTAMDLEAARRAYDAARRALGL